MKLSRNWLDEYVKINATDKEFADAMTMSGSKVEITEHPGEEILNVVAGRVIDIAPMVNSDHLFVCNVDVGRDRPVQIVTGAQNVNAGDIVPVALDGAVLPGGNTINAGMLRGVMSEGMLCSLGELELTLNDYPYADAEGIFILQEDCAVGQDIREVLGLDDSVVEFEITSNRPDCLSMIGLAREVSATFSAPLTLHDPVVKPEGGNITDMLDVEVLDGDLCPRYTARMVTDVKIGPSPKWLRERLRNVGLRPINNIVDITNYVMHEYGQPMHAFDFACVDGNKIIIRRANQDEPITTLDSSMHTLTNNMLVIADEQKAVGIAGVMGGENSEITENTVNIVFESANFNGTSIRKTAIALGMRTDASGRFEKGLDPMGTLPAVNRACELVQLLGAGRVVDGVIDVVDHIGEQVTLELEADRINKLLGTEIKADDMGKMLTSLGFDVNGTRIGVPSWRSDVRHMADLSEEVARLYGYNKMPTTMFKGETTRGFYNPRQKLSMAAENLCRAFGYSEILTYSFVGMSDFDKVMIPEDSPKRNVFTILNPLGENTSVMRTSSLPSMMGCLATNDAYHNDSVRLYEMAKVYLKKSDDALAYEPTIMTLGAYGGDMDFYVLKGALEGIFDGLNALPRKYTAVQDNLSYHPGRAAEVSIGGVVVGVLGEVHPVVCSNYDIEKPVYAAQIDFDLLISLLAGDPSYTPLPRYPVIERDIAVVCDLSVTVGELTDCIEGSGGKLLANVKLFDIYTGHPVPEGKKSVAFSLTLRAADRTLTDNDADEAVSGILKALGEAFGAYLR